MKNKEIIDLFKVLVDVLGVDIAIVCIYKINKKYREIEKKENRGVKYVRVC